MTKINIRFILMGCLFILFSCQKDPVNNPENKVPISDAGPSQAIQLPTNSVIMNGTGTDADGKVVAYLWSQVSGPAISSIENPGSASTNIKNLITGTYLFQLMVTDDKGATGVDTATIVISVSPVQTLSLQPANNPTEFQVTILNGQNQSFSGLEISIDAWTSGGQPWMLRELLKFDLSAIPSTATITSANLYLYSNPQPLTGNLVNANWGTANSILLQQVTSNWSTSTTSWFNQPTTSTTDQIIIPGTTQSTLDLNVDVTGMVNSMVSSNANYGFLLKLQNEVTYNSRIFVSSRNTTYPDKHPKLVVIYQ